MKEPKVAVESRFHRGYVYHVDCARELKLWSAIEYMVAVQGSVARGIYCKRCRRPLYRRSDLGGKLRFERI